MIIPRRSICLRRAIENRHYPSQKGSHWLVLAITLRCSCRTDETQSSSRSKSKHRATLMKKCDEFLQTDPSHNVDAQ